MDKTQRMCAKLSSSEIEHFQVGISIHKQTHLCLKRNTKHFSPHHYFCLYKDTILFSFPQDIPCPSLPTPSSPFLISDLRMPTLASPLTGPLFARVATALPPLATTAPEVVPCGNCIMIITSNKFNLVWKL